MPFKESLGNLFSKVPMDRLDDFGKIVQMLIDADLVPELLSPFYSNIWLMNEGKLFRPERLAIILSGYDQKEFAAFLEKVCIDREHQELFISLVKPFSTSEAFSSVGNFAQNFRALLASHPKSPLVEDTEAKTEVTAVPEEVSGIEERMTSEPEDLFINEELASEPEDLFTNEELASEPEDLSFVKEEKAVQDYLIKRKSKTRHFLINGISIGILVALIAFLVKKKNRRTIEDVEDQNNEYDARRATRNEKSTLNF